jgi:hypothetical protein
VSIDLNSRLGRRFLIELFAFGNLVFLALDIYVAHSYNEFGHEAEWIPFGFSIIGSLFLLPTLSASLRGRTGRPLPGLIVGALSVLVGLTGLYFHLESQFLVKGSLVSLVYSAPLAAPLAYCGIGMLLLLNRLKTENEEWGSWVLFLAAGGFFGNFALTLLDHAQNGFFHPTEWIAVASSAIACSFMLIAITGLATRQFFNSCIVVSALQVVVGLYGFVLHYHANTHATSESMWDNFVFGAPVFAPMLLCDMAVLAMIGLMDRRTN